MDIYALISVLALAVCYVVFFKYVKIDSKVLSLYSLFSVLWFVIIILSSMRLFGLYETSSKFYGLICLGVIFWLLGYFANMFYLKVPFVKSMADKRSKKNEFEEGKEKNDSYKAKKYVVNLKVMAVFLAIIAAYTVVILIKSTQLTAQGYSLEQVHDIFLNRGEVPFFEISAINTIYSKLMVPCLYAIIPVSAIMLFEQKNKINVIFSVISIALVMIYGFVSGSRITIVYLMVDLLLTLGIYWKKVPKKMICGIFIAVGVGVISILLITVVRRKLYLAGNYADLFDTYYTYLTICMPLGDYWTDYVDSNNIITYGAASLRGILANVNYPLSKVHLGVFTSIIDNVTDIINITDENYIQIATAHRANAYVTWIFHLYLDFRRVGVVVGSFIFGALTGFLEKHSTKHLMYCAYFLLFSQAIVKSFVRWEFGIAAYVLAFVYMRFLFKREKECTE